MNDNQNLKETLSALLDHQAGKVDALELRRLARALENDTGLVQDYRRFSLASAVLRGEPASTSVDLLSGIQQRLQGSMQSAAPEIPPAPRRAWLKVAGQWAVAASVATMTIWLLQTHPSPEPAQVVSTSPVEKSRATDPAASFAADSVKLGAAPTHRLVNAQALSVNVGSAAPEPMRATQTTCVIAGQGLPAGSGMQALHLPEGYVLCRLDHTRQRCQDVSAAVACYLP